MAKVQLVLSDWSELPTYTFDEFDTDTSRSYKEVNICAVRVIADDLEGKNISFSTSGVIKSEHVSNLLGKLLTYVDATYPDPQQRKAHKDILSNTVWEWFTSRENSSGRLIEDMANNEKESVKSGSIN